MDDEERTTSFGLIRFASDFRKAAQATDKALSKEVANDWLAPIPALYLMGHSTELGFKAYLRHKGRDLNTLRRIGHNLETAYSKCKAAGILEICEFSKDELKAMGVLNDLYRTKMLNYIKTGSCRFPNWGTLESLNRELIKNVSLSIGYPGAPLA
ncbi:hypothetical protein [Alcanivorax sp. 1008]|uniref:hypothetical protein n=1 Tax=Alcanivorax sp. 1008 TaxID=2816853 RepID=UPI001E08722E|nr:hypothetical protein [Alcanivorax sp. 1008]MCC1495324.1 hypothetical protein [Alcanivorax sp. 1008]